MTSPSTLGLSSCTMSATLDLPSQPAPPTHSSGPVFAIVTPRDRCRTLSDFFVIPFFPSCCVIGPTAKMKGALATSAVAAVAAVATAAPYRRTERYYGQKVYQWYAPTSTVFSPFFPPVFSVKIAGSASGFVRRKHGRGKGRKKERKRTAGETQRGCFAMRTCADLARCPRAFSPLFSRN